MSDLKARMAIGNIASFLGTRSGSLHWKKILSSYGFPEPDTHNKTEGLAQAIRMIYGEDRNELLKFLNGLLKYHRLDTEDRKELNSYLVSLGFQLEGNKIVEIPVEEDFFKFFMESLEHPRSRPAVEGARDGAIITLCEKINGMTSDYTLVDYGCGEGRLVYGLNLIDEKVLSKMSYIGIDKNPDYLESIEKAIKKLGFDEKVKSYNLLSPKQLFERDQLVDFIFLINVLHEIPLIDLAITLKELEWKLRKAGHVLIHEMREFPEGEMGFVSWEPDDFVEAFKETSLKPHIHQYETKSGIPLINVDVVKMTKKKTDYLRFASNLVRAYDKKVKKIDLQLRDIKKSGVKSKKYASLLVLRDNIETQLDECGTHFGLDTLGPLFAKSRFFCPTCGSNEVSMSVVRSYPKVGRWSAADGDVGSAWFRCLRCDWELNCCSSIVEKIKKRGWLVNRSFVREVQPNGAIRYRMVVKKIEDQKLRLKEVLEREVTGAAMVSLLSLSEKAKLDIGTIISLLKSDELKDLFERVQRGRRNWVQMKREGAVVSSGNEKYVVYVTERKNKAIVHQTRCPVYMNRKFNPQHVYWSDQVLPFGHGIFETREEAEDYAKGTRMTDTRTCIICLKGEYIF